jgi:uncharacterized protein with PIN domain
MVKNAGKYYSELDQAKCPACGRSLSGNGIEIAASSDQYGRTLKIFYRCKNCKTELML